MYDKAVVWASANRELIACRLLEQLSSDYWRILDLTHNSITRLEVTGKQCLLHRKGAVPSDQDLIVIPGSRGTLSYLVKPTAEQSPNLWSVAHGAGRKWGRNECAGRLREKFSVESLRKTRLGSYVICEDRDLLYCGSLCRDLGRDGAVDRVFTVPAGAQTEKLVCGDTPR